MTCNMMNISVELVVFISVYLQVLKCLNQFVQNFPSLTGSEFMSMFLTPYLTKDEFVFHLFFSCLLKNSSFQALTTLFLAAIVGPLWQTFVTSLRVRSSIEVTDLYEGRYDSDGSEKSFDSFIIQVITLMHA